MRDLARIRRGRVDRRSYSPLVVDADEECLALALHGRVLELLLCKDTRVSSTIGSA